MVVEDLQRGALRMPAEKPSRRENGKHAKRRAAVAAAVPESKRELVDIDPWSMLLEQLREVPEESTPAERERPKRK
jgi:hypothetical protein